MTQKCGGALQTDEQVHWMVVTALGIEEKRETRRFGGDVDKARVDVTEHIMSEAAPDDLEKIVHLNEVGGTNSLSKSEWLSTEALMPPEEKQTHLNLRAWMTDHANSCGIKEVEEDEDEDDAEMVELLAGLDDGGIDDEVEEEPVNAVSSKVAAEKEKESVPKEEKLEKEKNWSAVSLTWRDSKLAFRGSFSAVAFTNWVWWRMIRPKLEETKAKLADIDISDNAYGIEMVEKILGEFAGPMKKKKKTKRRTRMIKRRRRIKMIKMIKRKKKTKMIRIRKRKRLTK